MTKMKKPPVVPRVLLQYEIVDEMPNGRLIRETHRWAIPGNTDVESVLEHVGNTPNIDLDTVRLYSVIETEEF
jgi:hypothetical protein